MSEKSSVQSLDARLASGGGGGPAVGAPSAASSSPRPRTMPSVLAAVAAFGAGAALASTFWMHRDRADHDPLFHPF